VVIMKLPKDIKAFYMRANDDGRTVAAMDVLAPGIGRSSAARSARSGSTYWTPAGRDGAEPRRLLVVPDLRRYGTVPHAGFGLASSAPWSMPPDGQRARRDPLPRTPRNATSER